MQVVEVLNRLDIGIRRAYCQTISNGIHPYFLGTFYLRHRGGQSLDAESRLVQQMKQELCNTQILAYDGYSYREWVTNGLMSGDDAALVNAFIAFCHTNLAHNCPDRFGLEDVQSAFHNHPEMARQLVRLLRLRFDPELPDRQHYQQALAETSITIQDYNTGHRWLDDIRRTIYRCCLLLITNTLKTNFFVVEKQALAFRLDPLYLRELGSEFIADLPDTPAFRITFFFSRCGHGYHIGFSDIARGGWRTVIARTKDDAITVANGLLREVYVLAHTQHLKTRIFMRVAPRWCWCLMPLTLPALITRLKPAACTSCSTALPMPFSTFLSPVQVMHGTPGWWTTTETTNRSNWGRTKTCTTA